MFTVTADPIHYSSKQFGLWRIAFGFYLTFYYLRLLPYAVEVFGSQGAFPTAYLGARSFFPSVILEMASSRTVQWLVAMAAVCSFCIMIGLGRRWAAFILWIIVAWLYNRNFFTDSPDYSFANWLIFILILIPTGEELSLSKKNRRWQMPKAIYWGAWIVLIMGYFEAGLSKIRFAEAGWLDGSALYYVLTTDNTRLEWYGNILNHIPQVMFWPLTYSALLLQVLAPLLAIPRTTRMWWWLAITGMHVMILIFINLPQVTWAMILYHLFIWDNRWNLARISKIGAYF